MNERANRDCGELVEILHEECVAYRALLTLSRAQKGAFDEGGTAALTKIIARKQEVINRLENLDGRLRPYTSQWHATIEALPGQAKRLVEGSLSDISTLLHEIIGSEKEIEETVTAARDRIAGEARSISGGLKAAMAYRRGELAATGSLLDREE